MLTHDENELLTRVDAGTPMGNLLRNYWLPAVLSKELPEQDGKPLRLRLLAEDLIAFRMTDGAVAVVAERCAHRGASLYYGRNEDCGIRCVYHGWKYDSTGQCVDTPNEPPTSRFKQHIKVSGYRTYERRGIVWVYMGNDPNPGEPPMLEWNILPSEQTYVSKRVEFANWVQVLEGGIDSSHGSFLHRYLDVSKRTDEGRRGGLLHTLDTHPYFEIMDTDYGSVIGARRTIDDNYYWRLYQFLMPFYTMIPPYATLPLGGHGFVPRDNTTTVIWSATWHPERSLTPDDVTGDTGLGAIHVHDFLPPSPEADGAWFPAASRANDYLQDWSVQQTKRFSGIPGVPMQDAAMQESMGPIYDRTQEHLGSADAAIAHVRMKWLTLAKALADGGEPVMPGLGAPELYRVRACSVMLEQNVAWYEAAQPWLHVQAGVLLPSV